MLVYLDEFPTLRIRYIALVGKADQGKTLITCLLEKLFTGQSDMTDYAMGETQFTGGLECYGRLVNDPKRNSDTDEKSPTSPTW